MAADSDKAKANEYRDRLRPLLEQVGQIMDEARDDGMDVQFNLSAKPGEKTNIGFIKIIKPVEL